MADMNVYIYPNTSAEDDLAQQAYSALDAALTDTTNYHPDLNTYHLEIDYSHPSLNDPDKRTFKSNLEDWAWMNASGNGCHLALSSNWGGGIADSGEWDENAFIEEAEAVAGSSSDGGPHFKNICIQEAYHPFIDASLGDVSQITGPNNDEHSLGEVNSSNDVTPMVTSYQDDGLDGVGRCDDSYNKTGYTVNPTYCTNQAIHQTFQDRVQGLE